MTHQPDTSPQAVPYTLLSSDHWSETLALQVMQENLTRFMGKLAPLEQSEYLRLCKEQMTRETILADALRRFYDVLDRQLLQALEHALKAKVGRPVNARTTYLKTRVRQLPIPASELPTVAPNDPLGLRLGISKEDLTAREYERSITLLEAAHRNFGFTQYFSTEEQRASYISDDALSVIDFVKIAREVDIGNRIEKYLEQHFDDQLSGPLFGVQGNQLLLAVWDAYRSDGPASLTQSEFNTLRSEVFNVPLQWDAYQLDAGGEKIDIPFFTRRVDSEKGTRVYSYFPGRPSGALRSHFSIDDAISTLQDEVRNEIGLEKLAWFMGALSLNNQEKIRTFIKPLTVNRDELYWHARILYDLFASKTPNTQKLRIERYGVVPRSLAHALPVSRGWVIQSDLIRLARNTRVADRETSLELLKYLVSETLSMLLLPLPGGVTGLSKVMLVAMLGTLAHQSFEAVIALRQGRQADMIQAVADIFDLLVSTRVQGVAHTLSNRRTRQLLTALGHPRHGLDARGGAGLWFLDKYTQVEPASLQGLQPSSEGLFEKNGAQYIRLVVEEQEKIARVIREPGSERYRLTHPGARYEPPVRYYPQQQRWMLDPVDTRPLGNAQWLQLMLPSNQVSLSLQGCQLSLDMAGISRQQLRSLWTGRQEAPWPLLQVIEDQHLREQLATLREALHQPDTPLPTIANQALPALLADLSRCAINLYDAAGTALLSSYSPVPGPNERPAQQIELLHLGADRYRTRSVTSTPEALLPRVLLEYERLIPDGVLGKTGHNAQDQHLENRVVELRRKTARHFDQHLQGLHAALLIDQPRAQVASQSIAHRFAPLARAGEDTAARTLRRRAPELSAAAAHDLVRRFPPLGQGEYTPVNAAAGTALQASIEQSVLARALGAISSPNGAGLDPQSEVIFGHLLTLLPSWPSAVALQVYQATLDHAGRPKGRGSLLDTFGHPDADTFVMLVKSATQYAGYLQDSGELSTPPANENSLTGATLRALTDSQRDALGRNIHDISGLAEDIIGQARRHYDYLKALLIPSPLSPLSSQSLQDFRAFDMRQVSRLADADGIHELGGRKYINIDQTAYQVMLDRDASSPLRKVWRIVKTTDPVASDTANTYNASRAGQSRAVCRNAANVWVSIQTGLAGGMPRDARAHDNRMLLLQRHEPIKQAFDTLASSNAKYSELWDKAHDLPQGSTAETAALITLEVHILKHLKLLADYVNRYIDEKDWLILLKAGGLYKQELLEQQMIRVEYFNKLIAVMDRRVLPTLQGPTVTADAYKRALVQLDKKLEVLKDRQTVEEQIKKADRSAGPQLDRINDAVPGVTQINYTKLNVLLHLLWENPHEPPPVGMRGLTAAYCVMDDLKNISGPTHPLALQLAQEQIIAEKQAFNALLASETPTRVETINAIIGLLDSFETTIEKRLSDFYEQLDSNAQLPSFDQDIDFDFIPPQAADSTQPPITKKMFRTRQHGTYRLLVGDKHVAADGSVTLNVEDPFRPEAAPRRYEKAQGEWRPIAVRTDGAALPVLIRDAGLALSSVDKHLEDALGLERQNTNPTNILEFLGTHEDRLHDLATMLEANREADKRTDATNIASRLRAAAASMNVRGHEILVRMYKNKEVLDVLRLNYLLEHAQVSVTRSAQRKQIGKGKQRSFLDVYSINDRTDASPLWEAHFHYDRKDRPAKDYTIKGAHLKTLRQSRQGSAFQQQEEQAGRAHQPIWREVISPKVAQRIFDQAT